MSQQLEEQPTTITTPSGEKNVVNYIDSIRFEKARMK